MNHLPVKLFRLQPPAATDMTEQTMDVDSDTRSEMMDLVVEEEKPDIVAKVLAVKVGFVFT